MLFLSMLSPAEEVGVSSYAVVVFFVLGAAGLAAIAIKALADEHASRTGKQSHVSDGKDKVVTASIADQPRDLQPDRVVSEAKEPHNRKRRISSVFIVVILCLLTAILGGKIFGLYDIHFAAGSVVPSGLESGQIFLSLHCCYLLSPGDLVVYSDGDRDYVRQYVGASENEGLRVRELDGNPRTISETDLIGKVIWRF